MKAINLTNIKKAEKYFSTNESRKKHTLSELKKLSQRELDSMYSELLRSKK